MYRNRKFYFALSSSLCLMVVVLSFFTNGFAALRSTNAARATNQITPHYRVASNLNRSGLSNITKSTTHPTPSRNNKSSASPSLSQGAMTYHSGTIMNSPQIYTIFWAPNFLQDNSPTSMSSQYLGVQEQFIQDLNNSPLLKVATQYYDNTYGHFKGSLTYNPSNDSILDLDSYPGSPINPHCSDPAVSDAINCINQTDIEYEIEATSALFGLGTGPNTLYIVYTTKGEGTCTNDGCFAYGTTGWCGYHADATAGSTNYFYAYIPYSASATGLYAGACYPSNSHGVIPVPGNDEEDYAPINFTSHELMEAITNPDLSTGWFYLDKSHEIGDMCYTAFPSSFQYDSGQADISLNGHYYTIQKEWSNYDYALTGQGCELRKTPGAILDGTIYTGYGANLLAYNTIDGSPRWATWAGGNYPVSNPIVYNGVVYYGSYGQLNMANATTGAYIGRFSPAISGLTITNGVIYMGAGNSLNPEQAVYAYSTTTDAQLWSTSLNGNPIPSPVVSNGVVYVVTNNDYLYAISAKTGKVLWNDLLDGGNSSIYSLAVANGTVYYVATCSNGICLTAFDTKNKTQLWQNSLAGIATEYASIMAGGIVYIETQSSSANIWGGDVYAFYANNGSSAWSTPFTTGYNPGQFAVVGNTVYVAAGTFYALNASNGSLRWSQFYGAYGVSNLAASNKTTNPNVVFAVSNQIFAINGSNGLVFWSSLVGVDTTATVSFAGY